MGATSSIASGASGASSAAGAAASAVSSASSASGGSTPGGLASCTVLAAGQPLDQAIQLTSIHICKEINKIPLAKLVFLDGSPAAMDFPISDQDFFAPGQTIEIDLGYDNNNTAVFTGLIITHGIRVDRRGSSLHLECKDNAVKMTMVPTSKHYNNITDSDLAAQLIAKYPDLKSITFNTTVTNENLVQCSMTDWDFMVSRMDRLGMITTVDQATVTIAAPDPTTDPVIDLVYGTNILEFEANMDARTQVESVQLSNWDAPSQSVQSTSSQYQAPSTEEGNIDASDLASALSISLLDMRTSAAFAPDEAQAVADARQMKNVLSKIRGRVKFQGFSGVDPGDMVSLDGLGDRFTGPAFVSSVTHDYADGNWTTEVNLGMPLDWFSEKVSGKSVAGSGSTPVGSASPNVGTGLFSTLQGLQVGIVNSIQDPDNEFKVQVKMPAINPTDDGIWARIATLDAGNNRGSFFMPEVSDEVILGFINGDPSQPIILGMMNSSALPAALTPSSSNDQKGFTTRTGMQLLFDDGQDSITITTPGGRQFTLNDNGGSVQLTDGSNTLSFGSSGVTLQSSGSLTLQAQGSVSISGSDVTVSGQSSAGMSAPTVSISGSGQTSISGGMVQIN
jgi:Rhs element Vgr protein